MEVFIETFFEGYMDELRISNTPRYSASYSGTIGDDTSGQGNSFTPNNFTSSDVFSSSPTLEKATLNPITGFTNRATLSNGNLNMSGSAGFKEISTIAVDGTSKFYYEVVNTSAAGWQLVGVFVGQPDNPSNALSSTPIWGFASTQATYYGGSYTSTSDVPGWSNNDVMGIKYENGNLKLYKNGTLATATTSSVPTGSIVFAYIANDNTNAAAFVRFNSDSWTQDSAAGVDAIWELSSANLSPNVPSILEPQKHFNTLLYSGDNATSRSITGLEFAPDLIIQKRRSDVSSLVVWDSVRGVNKTLYTEDTYAETTSDSTGYITGFGSNGFTFALSGGSEAQLNASGHTYLAWCWKGGGAAVTNNVGSISSQVSVNTKAGFSIVTYTGTGSSTTVGHGLGVKPGWIIIKCRSNVDNWMVYHNQANGGSSPEDQYFELNAQGGDIDSTAMLNDTAPTSTVVTIGSDNSVNGSGRTYVMYCWNEIPGYSKFGGFTGNGSTDGTYVNLGFRPAWLMLKRADSSSEWNIWDINRNVGEQPLAREIRASRTYAESGYDAARYVDFLSNGFKMRTSDADHNASGGRYIYMAFADQTGSTPYGTETNAFR